MHKAIRVPPRRVLLLHALSTRIANAPLCPRVYANYKHGAIVKRPVHLRLSEDCRAFVYTTDIGGSKGGTKLLPVCDILEVTECAKDGPCCFAIATSDRQHKFDAQSPAEKKLWIKAVWDAISVRHYAAEQMPVLLAGATMSKHGQIFKRPVRFVLCGDGQHFEYADYDVASQCSGAKKTIAVGSVQEVLDFGGATLGFDVAGDRVHKMDAESAVTKATWVEALRGCLENAKYHGMLLRTAAPRPVAGSVAHAPAKQAAPPRRQAPACDDDDSTSDDDAAASARRFDDLRKKYALQSRPR